MKIMPLLDRAHRALARPVAAALFSIALGAASLASAAAPQVKPHYQFSKADFVIPGIDASMRTRYFLGEPVIVPLRLINHTEHPLTLQTDFNPRNRLHIIIRQIGQPTRTFHGIYRPNAMDVKPLDIYLYPLEEFTSDFVMWGDLERPTGLAFPEPGDYTINITQEITIPEASFSKEFVVGTKAVHIDPAPAAWKPFIDDLTKDLTDKTVLSSKPAYFLQLKTTPPGWESKMDSYIELMRSTPLLPYLYLSAADELQVEWSRTDDAAKAKALADKAMQYYQLAADGKSAFKLDALSMLLKFEDRLGVSNAAEATAKTLIKNLPDFLVGKYGGSKLLDKYLNNTAEIDPVRFWWLFP